MKGALLCAAILLAGSAGTAFGQGFAGADARAQELMSQARAAIGGPEQVKSVRTLEVSAKFRRLVGKDEQTGEVTFDIWLPDKFRQVVTREFANVGGWTQTDTLNGTQAFRTSASNSPQVVIRDESGAGSRVEAEAKIIRKEYYRYMIAWLLTPPQDGFEISYFGEAEAADGKADVLDVRGPDEFSLRLFMDKDTHLIRLVSYEDAIRPVVSAEDKGRGRNDGDKSPSSEMPKLRQKEVQLYFSDYRPVGGLRFPFQIKQATGGNLDQEWTVTKVKVNPNLSTGLFEKK